MPQDASVKVALIGYNDSHVPQWVQRSLDEAGIDFVHRQCGSAAEVVDLARDAQILWTFASNPAFTAPGWCELIAEALGELENCGAIIRAGSGTDNVPVQQATERGIVVANTPAATAEPVAEHAVALMLAVARQVVYDAVRMRAGEWSQPVPPTGISLAQKTVGLVGFGQIAQLVARRLRGFYCTILTSDPIVSSDCAQQHAAKLVSLDELLSKSDFVSLHCPLLDSTRHMISTAQLKGMKSSAILINTSRGEVVDESALITALQEKWIAGAGLDVLEQEPPKPTHPLLTMDNVVCTPHVAAFSEQLFSRMWQLSIETILHLARGQWPPSCVNRDVKPCGSLPQVAREPAQS